MEKKKILLEWLRIAAGLLVFALGVHLTIFANIGLAPWDCLGMGIALHTPLNYGLAMTALALAIVGIDLLLKERIGYGTLIDAVLTGNFVQMFNDLNPLPKNENTALGIVIMLAGFVFMALGMWIYMNGRQCCGPRDSRNCSEKCSIPCLSTSASPGRRRCCCCCARSRAAGRSPPRRTSSRRRGPTPSPGARPR